MRRHGNGSATSRERARLADSRRGSYDGALSHPNSGLPESGTLALRSRPQSDNSDFGWARAREAIPQSRYYPAARRTSCGCGKRSPASFYCFRPVLYNEWRNASVSSHERTAQRHQPSRCVTIVSECRRARSPPPTCRCRRPAEPSTLRACWPWLRSQSRRSAASPPE
jgi:hypothetical protein